jgi:hypothetical protein
MSFGQHMRSLRESAGLTRADKARIPLVKVEGP